jgi:hypothetical protein
VRNDAELVAEVSTSDGEQMSRYENVDRRTPAAFRLRQTAVRSGRHRWSMKSWNVAHM